MKRDVIQALWNAVKESDEGCQFVIGLMDHESVGGPEVLDEAVVQFAKLLMFEAAKTVCVECKMNGRSEPTRDPLIRIHTHHGAKDYVVRNTCRAPSFYLEEENPPPKAMD